MGCARRQGFLAAGSRRGARDTSGEGGPDLDRVKDKMRECHEVQVRTALSKEAGHDKDIELPGWAARWVEDPAEMREARMADPRVDGGSSPRRTGWRRR